MARTLNKLDRMANIESVLNDADILADYSQEITDHMSELESLQEAVQTVVDYVTEAMNSASEAQGYHEDRQWEDRDNALSEIEDSLERVTTALETINGIDLSELRKIDDEVNTVTDKVEEAKEDLAHLL